MRKVGREMPRKSSEMVETNEPENVEEIDVALVTTAPDDWEFETVKEESPTIVMFETIGDSFVGQYTGTKFVEMPDPADNFTIYLFRARDAKLYGLYQSFAMEEGMKEVPMGAWARITFMSEIPVKKGQPMKNLRFEVRKQ